NESILADGKLGTLNLASVFAGTVFFHGAVGAGEINDSSADPRTFAGHFDDGSWASGGLGLHREGPNFEVRALQTVQLHLESVLIKCCGAVDVLDINLKPADGIVVGIHGASSCVVLFTLRVPASMSIQGRKMEAKRYN